MNMISLGTNYSVVLSNMKLTCTCVEMHIVLVLRLFCLHVQTKKTEVVQRETSFCSRKRTKRSSIGSTLFALFSELLFVIS